MRPKAQDAKHYFTTISQIALLIHSKLSDFHRQKKHDL